MAQTCAEMVAEVKRRCGRTGDTALITDDQVTTWLNEVQVDIVDRIPGMEALNFRNTDSLDTTGALRYALADITAGDYTSQQIAEICDVFYLDGASSIRLNFVHTDEFDANWPDPTSSDAQTGLPHHWARRGGNIEIRPLCGSGYWDTDLGFVGHVYARDFTGGDSTEYSDLSRADFGMKEFALAQAWRTIGDKLKASDFSESYVGWLDRYDLKQNRLNAWDGNLYSDNIG